jgi:hypothetical protein
MAKPWTSSDPFASGKRLTTIANHAKIHSKTSAMLRAQNRAALEQPVSFPMQHKLDIPFPVAAP